VVAIRARRCLIAAVAIRNGISLMHRDADFDAIARHSPLAVLDLGARLRHR
jgi:predicted nucleic acid-binding protein